MSDVPSNLIPTRITQLPLAPVASEDSLMMIVYQGNNYQIRVGDLLSVAGVPTSRQVIAGTSLTGGGALSSNVTLSVAVGGIGNTQLAATGVASGTYGDATNIPVFTVDEKGRIQAATTVPATISGYVPVTRQVIAGTGLNGGGALNANVTLNANLSDATPLETDGLGTSGVSTDMARADHQHPSVNLGVSSEVDGVLTVANGGTSRSIVPDAGAIIWSGADGLYVGPVGAAGQVMQSNGTGEYLWVNQSTLDVGQADNLNGGAANRIPYQSATDVTGFIAAPTDAETLLKWNGTGFEWGTVAGAGTVTSVGLALPADFNVTNSPVTASGTLTGAWANQTTNKVLAAPNGSTGTPTFRALANADLPVSGVTADTYGSTTAIPVVTVNAQGIVTGVTTAAITGGLVYQGSWNASTNTPTLASGVGTNGYYYIVSVAGSTNLDGITDWQVGDWAIFNGATWQKIDQTNLVSSVNGEVGVVVLDYADVGAPSATGTGASGTWAIDISGNAATATSATSATTATTATSATSATTATNVAGGAANKIVYNTASGTSSFIDAPVTAGHYLKWTGSAFEWNVAGTGTVTSIDVSGGTTGLTTSGGPVTSSGTITLSGTLATTNGGTGLTSFTAGDLPYYATGTALSKLGIGTTDYILTSSGTAPQYTNPASITVGSATSATSATTATNLAGGAASQIAYQTGSGATSFIANGTAGQVLTSAGSSVPAWGGINGGTF